MFDVILAMSCLFHIPKIELASHAIPTIDALLKPGGHLVVSLMIGEGASYILSCYISI
jgi:2-polyprenyl-3-methyl-5-hydroxy-6-metoxy-1,4-benzoquinol methylase